MRKRTQTTNILIWASLLGGLLWIAAKVAMSYEPGILFNDFAARFEQNCINIFHFKATNATVGFLFLAAIAWIVILANYLIRSGQYMHGKEHGSAAWGDIRRVNAMLSCKTNDDRNVIVSKNVRVDLQTREVGNVNTLVIGGSGSGKTRYFVKPNLMQENASYFVIDPAGELLRDLGWMFERDGYEIKVINTIDLRKSNQYNPFRYIATEQDVYTLINIIMENTRKEGANSVDPFWDECATLLLQALMMYLWYEVPLHEQTMPNLMFMLDHMAIEENDTSKKSTIDNIFDELEEQEPGHIAVRLYRAFREKAPGKTALSVLITIQARLNAMYIDAVQEFFSGDMLELDKFVTQKTIIFAVISDAETSFNFIISMLYSQLFLYSYRLADTQYGGQLPIPIRILLEEFANCAVPREFTNKLNTCRKRGISITIVIQAMSQLKKLFKDDWETIVGTCGLRVYLGGEEQSTHESISKELGRATIKYDTYNKTMRDQTTNINSTGRELMTLDEVRAMKRDECIVFIQYQKPILDKKYDLLRHKRIDKTADGKEAAYVYDQKAYIRRRRERFNMSNILPDLPVLPESKIVYSSVNKRLLLEESKEDTNT